MGKYKLAIPAMGIAVLSAAVLTFHKAPGAEPIVLAPAPIIDEPLAKTPGIETAILSGGRFWGMQVVFQHVKGVKSAISGYIGGSEPNALYERVSTGTTGHAEAVQITFDPSIISYGTILRIYFSVAADPTELNYQGPDNGNQYRGEIWVENMEQRLIATAYLAQLATAQIYSDPIVTRINNARPFYAAEDYHQNYATLHSTVSTSLRTMRRKWPHSPSSYRLSRPSSSVRPSSGRKYTQVEPPSSRLLLMPSGLL